MGVIFTLLAIVSVSGQMLIAKDRIKKINANVLVFYRVAIGCLLIAFWTFYSERANFHVSSTYWLVTLLGAFLGPTLSFHFFFRSYRYWEFSKSSAVLTMQPLIVLPLAYLFLGELPDSMQMVGGIIMLIGALWLTLGQFSQPKEIIPA